MGTALCGMIMAVKGLPPVNLLIIVLIGTGPIITTAINLLNAIFDLETDKINKPYRPLPSGRLEIRYVAITAAILYAAGLLGALWLGFYPFIFAVFGLALSLAYSVPPIRLKNRGITANFALALGYSAVTFLGGWSLFEDVSKAPYIIVAFIIVQVTGANVVKDMGDYRGDKKLGIKTLPVRLGIINSAKAICPLVIGPYFAIPLFYTLEIFTWSFLIITVFAVWGIFMLSRLIKEPTEENCHRAFFHAFFMSLLTEFAFAFAYIFS